LYGRATPELAHIFDQIPSPSAEPVPGTAPKKTATRLPKTIEPAGGMAVKRAAKKANKLVKEAVLPTDAPPGQPVTQQKQQTPQAQQAAQALQRGLQAAQQKTPNIDHAFATGIIKQIEPDGTIVIAGENSTGKIKQLLALGGGAQFKVVSDHELAVAQQKPVAQRVQEVGGVGVVKSTKDPRYSMSQTADVDGSTLGREMRAYHLAENDEETQPLSNALLMTRVSQYQERMAELAESLLHEGDAMMQDHYRQQLYKIRDRILQLKGG
jgi:hypothetical protein